MRKPQGKREVNLSSDKPARTSGEEGGSGNSSCSDY
jgi:hypothetical protein